jgi:hypothetical protein
MIEFLMHDGGCFPRVACDVCSKTILDAKDGIVVWSEDGKQIAFAHRGQCSIQLDHSNGWPYWDSLDVFFRNLLVNVKLSPAKLKKVFDYFGVTTSPKVLEKA